MSYTINQIQDEMTAAGSHWWDRDSMRFFRTRVSEKCYQGSGGIYFVSSETCGDQPRAYSVRQYKPESKQIDTIGDFNSLTRAQAHTEAARLAGPSAVIVEEAHKPATAAEQLARDIQSNGGTCEPATAAHLIRLATKHARLMVDYCNGLEVYDEEGEPLPRLASLVEHITGAAKRCNCGVIFSGDPRGATVKLILPSGESNSFGGEGWIVPTRD